jgi:hypothetical protein
MWIEPPAQINVRSHASLAWLGWRRFADGESKRGQQQRMHGRAVGVACGDNSTRILGIDNNPFQAMRQRSSITFAP